MIPLDVALLVAEALDRLGLAYFLGGSLASSVQGEPRGKLLWFRQGGLVSNQQWRDVVQVLRVSGPTLDPEYLDHWAKALTLSELLAQARADASS